MFQSFNKFLAILLVLLAISGCRTKQNTNNDILPGINVPVEKLNKDFVLEDDPGLANTYQNGFLLAFGVQNKSQEEIIFSNNYGVKIFVKHDGTWNEIENRMNYPEDKISVVSLLRVLSDFGKLWAKAL